MDWIKVDTRPKKSGKYIVHIWESPYFAFRGLEKTNSDDSVSISHRCPDLVTEAYYDKEDDEWKYKDCEDNEVTITGSQIIVDYKDAVYQTKVIEWQPLPSFISPETPFTPINEKAVVIEAERHRNKIKPEEAMVIDEAFSELVKKRYESCRILEKCGYKRMGYGVHADQYIEICSKDEFSALCTYFSTTIYKDETISLQEPVSEGYQREGLYKVSWDKEKKNYCICKVNSVSEMFRSLKE